MQTLSLYSITHFPKGTKDLARIVFKGPGDIRLEMRWSEWVDMGRPVDITIDA